MIKKSQMETLIFCADKEFKYRAINFMNNIAFNSEKVAVESVSEAKAELAKNAKLLNIIIEGAVFGKNLNHQLEAIKDICAKKDSMVVMYLTAEEMKDFKHAKHGIPNLIVETLPFDKTVFNEAFHSRKTGGISRDAKKLGALAASAPAAEPAAPQAKKSSTAFEASAHLRETIAMINIIDKNREALEQIINVGQRFNGLVGAFGYFAVKDGYKEVRNLAHDVDEISRHYGLGEHDKITDVHYNLLLDAAKCCFKILQFLRDAQEVPADLLTQAAQIHDRFEKVTDIKKRELISQDEVDKLLD